MKKLTVCALGLAMLLSFGACTTNAASKDNADDPGADVRNEQATDETREEGIAAPDGEAFGKRGEMPSDGMQPDGRGGHGKRRDSGTSADSTQPGGQGRHGNRDGSGTQTAPDGPGRQFKGDGSNGGKKQQKTPSESGGLTIVEPPEQAGEPAPDAPPTEDGVSDPEATQDVSDPAA